MYKPYKLVYVRFLDHASGPADSTKPFEIEAFGVLRNEDEKAYYIISWVAEKNLSDPNSECYVVLKSDVIEIQNLIIKGRKNGNTR